MLRNVLLTAAAFALVGPLVGIAYLTTLGSSGLETEPVGGALGFLWLLPFAYLIGSLPAALTGAVVGLIAGRAPTWAYVLTGVVAAAAAGGLVGWFGGEGPPPREGVVNLILMGAAAGLFSALAGALVKRSRPVPSPFGRPQ